MKKMLTLVAAVMIGTAAFAQQNELEMFKSMYKIEKKALLMDFLKLDDAQATAFWPMYDAYQTELAAIADKRIALITNYVNNYGTFTDAQADEMMSESTAIIKARTKLQEKYFGKAKKSIGSLKAAQFIQFERFVQTAIETELMSNLPLIGELE